MGIRVEGMKVILGILWVYVGILLDYLIVQWVQGFCSGIYGVKQASKRLLPDYVKALEAVK